MRLDVSSESSARQRIHLKHQALFSSKDKSEKLKCRLLQFLFGALRAILEVNYQNYPYSPYTLYIMWIVLSSQFSHRGSS